MGSSPGRDRSGRPTRGRTAGRGRTSAGGPRYDRLLLVFAGVALVLVSVGLVFVDVREAGNAVPAAPKDRALTLTVPSMKRVKDVPVYGGPAQDEAALQNGTLHVDDTGFPWEREANVYIAGHRLGFPNTESWLTFWDMNKVNVGDEVYVTDADGTKYTYKVFKEFTVGPADTSVTNPEPGKNILTLQTCTLPDYSQRLIVQAELTDTSEKAA